MKQKIGKRCGIAAAVILCALTALPAAAQLSGVVKSDEANVPVPFANIQVLGQDRGTSADAQGRFSLPETDSNATLVISAAGYEPLYTRFRQGDTPRLHRANIELSEVIVNKNRQGQELKTGSFKKSDVHLHFSGNGIPWILLRYFPYEESYSNTPYLKSLMIETHSEISDAIFNIRLYRKGVNGEPGAFLYEQNIIGHAKKGKQYTTIDLSDYNIMMPKDGLCIGIEFLRVAQNEYKFTYTDMSTKKKETKVQYAPSIGVLPSDTGENALVFMKGKWEPMWRNGTAMFHKTNKDKYNLFAMELTLTD